MPGKTLEVLQSIGRREIALKGDAERESDQAEAMEKSRAGLFAEAAQA